MPLYIIENIFSPIFSKTNLPAGITNETVYFILPSHRS